MRFACTLDPSEPTGKAKGRFIIAVSTVLTHVMDESEWKKRAPRPRATAQCL